MRIFATVARAVAELTSGCLALEGRVQEVAVIVDLCFALPQRAAAALIGGRRAFAHHATTAVGDSETRILRAGIPGAHGIYRQSRCFTATGRIGAFASNRRTTSPGCVQSN